MTMKRLAKWWADRKRQRKLAKYRRRYGPQGAIVFGWNSETGEVYDTGERVPWEEWLDSQPA
jgi:hypothetical protein